MQRTCLLLCLIITICYACFANYRLLQPSKDIHFLYLADAFLAGQVHLTQKPPHGNDWASYQVLTIQNHSQKNMETQLRGFQFVRLNIFGVPYKVKNC